MPLHLLAILTNAEMTAADRITIGRGTPGFTLMRRAGKAVAAEIKKRYAKQPVVVLAGPGNNGGDGFVIAQELLQSGWPVKLGLLGERKALRGDAAEAAEQYEGELHPLHPFLLNEPALVVDALFGTGLSRSIEGVTAEVLAKAMRHGLSCVAVDIPSGVSGDSGQVLGVAAPAELTVTFHRKKRGHVLMPGAQHCGEVVVADIGIDPAALENETIGLHENDPLLWHGALPWPQPQGHKFSRGHAVVQGGGFAHSGAARMTARAALRAGAGLVTVACDREALPIYAHALEAVMTREAADTQALHKLLQDERVTAFAIGPGAGVTDETKARVLAALRLNKPTVLDADAISCFADYPGALFDAVGGTPVILTPHAGEFARLFPDLADNEQDKVARACAAAKQSGAVVLLKGADTVIAAPDGRAVANTITSPWLATAGAGDVLAGICAGLLAGKMPAFEAACAATWMHGAAAVEYGAGLIAEDLPDILPAIWQYLYESDSYGDQ